MSMPSGRSGPSGPKPPPMGPGGGPSPKRSPTHQPSPVRKVAVLGGGRWILNVFWGCMGCKSINLNRPKCWVLLVLVLTVLTFCVSTPTLEAQICSRFSMATGAFGTAMANHLANKGITVQLWAREDEVELFASLCMSQTWRIWPPQKTVIGRWFKASMRSMRTASIWQAGSGFQLDHSYMFVHRLNRDVDVASLAAILRRNSIEPENPRK